MPTKPNKTGNEQNYVPAGNGDASGEYADNETGSNIHYFSKFKKPDGEIKSVAKKEKVKKPKKVVETDFEDDLDFDIDDLDLDELDDLDLKEPTSKEEIELEIKEKEEPQKTTVKQFANENKNAVKQIGIEELKTSFEDFYKEELDIEKVKQLSDKELVDLAVAVNVIDNKEAFKEFEESIKNDFLAKVESDEIIGGNNVWKNIPQTPKEFEESVEKKINYFSMFLNDENESISKFSKDKVEALQKLKDSPEFEQWKNAEKDYNIKKYQKLYDKYANQNNVYSQKAKNEAKWFKTSSSATAAYSPYANKVIDEWNKKDPEAIKMVKDYTGSYSSINYPLRGHDYPHKASYPEQSKQKQKEFLDHVEGMTKVLDSSTYDFNCWVQRGVSELNVGSKVLSELSSKDELDNLIGTTFKDEGFLSCGSFKGGGGMFAHNDIIMNIYCPKGTKMLFVKGISQYSSEDETIINRGYTYKITKTEKKNGKVYLDCEVILGSDANRYGKDKLQELLQKHF